MDLVILFSNGDKLVNMMDVNGGQKTSRRGFCGTQ
jgi:hypothetical protein